MTRKSTNQYVVHAYDDQSITLRRMWVPAAMSQVRIPRDRIASINRTLGFTTVRTFGGPEYRVNMGISRDRRAYSDKAIGAPSRGGIPDGTTFDQYKQHTGTVEDEMRAGAARAKQRREQAATR